MALSGIQIYKLLPQTNCKECGYPTCLAFAMKLAAKQVELSLCPYVSETSKSTLAESAAPPIRLVTLKADGSEVKAGNEVVMYRHEKTFYNKPGLFVKFSDALAPEELKKRGWRSRPLYHQLRRYQPVPGWVRNRAASSQPESSPKQSRLCARHQTVDLVQDPAILSAEWRPCPVKPCCCTGRPGTGRAWPSWPKGPRHPERQRRNEELAELTESPGELA
jgi:acetyl-CoA decarbonylase/synthase complex subunit gamma